MGTVLRTSQAHLDLVKLATDVGEENAAAADRLLDEIDGRCRLLAQFPEMGRKREELAPRLRSSVVGHYVIFYRPMADGIQVIRVLHGARDLPRLFE
jgi:toxin ParE1/3/4